MRSGVVLQNIHILISCNTTAPILQLHLYLQILQNSTVCTSTSGTLLNSKDRHSFSRGFNVIIKNLHPKTVLVYDSMPSDIFAKYKVGGLLKVSRQKTEPGELIDSGVLEQAQLRVGNTPAGNYFHIHLDTLAEADHLLLRLGDVSLFLLFPGETSLIFASQGTGFRAGAAALFQTVSQFY